MGLFRQMKQMKDAVAEAPDLVRSSMEMQQAMQATPPPGSAASSDSGAPAARMALDDEVISNVSLAKYAEICRVGTERGITDLAGVAGVAAEHGVDAGDWNAAMNAWNARFAHDTAAAMRFNALWRGIG